MTKYKKNQIPSVSDETVNEAQGVAKATQRPGQTKEQTKLIAQGIQKGIEQYKKQQKGKARELDKKLKKVNSKPAEPEQAIDHQEVTKGNTNWLPWVLLAMSWSGFVFYTLKLSD
jgi:hypothetical protein